MSATYVMWASLVFCFWELIIRILPYISLHLPQLGYDVFKVQCSISIRFPLEELFEAQLCLNVSVLTVVVWTSFWLLTEYVDVKAILSIIIHTCLKYKVKVVIF